MIGRSERITKMTRYHRLAAKIDQTHSGLQTEVSTFIHRVKSCLPARAERWWTAVFEDLSGEGTFEESSAKESSAENNFSESNSSKSNSAQDIFDGSPENEKGDLKQIREALMLEAEPLSVAFDCAQKMENQAEEPLRAKEALEAEIGILKFYKREIMRLRHEYKSLLALKNRDCRKGRRQWYRAVRKVRREMMSAKGSPLVQINQLQAALRKEIPFESGFPETEAGTLGDAATRSLAARNRQPNWKDKLERRRRPKNGIIEDAIWALYLSIAAGDPVPTMGATAKEAGEVVFCFGTDILRN